MKMFSVLLLLEVLFMSIRCAPREYQINYNTQLSLYYPYLDGEGFCGFGPIKGDAMVVSRGQSFGVALTGHKKDSAGIISSRRPQPMSNWRVDVSLRVVPGAEGVSVWFSREEAKEGNVFGGAADNGVIAFLNTGNKSISQPPSVGIAIIRGKAQPRVLFSKKVIPLEVCTVRVESYNGEVKVLYGRALNSLQEIGRTTEAYIPRGHFISVSGSNKGEVGDVLVKSISVSRIFMAKPRGATLGAEERGSTSSLLVWGVFILLIIGVGYYMYNQKKKLPKKPSASIRY